MAWLLPDGFKGGEENNSELITFAACVTWQNAITTAV